MLYIALHWCQHSKATEQLHSVTLKRKTRIEPLVYYSISKGFEMVSCDVRTSYCIESSLPAVGDRLWVKSLCDCMQHVGIKVNHFIVNWELIWPIINALILPMEAREWKCSVMWLEYRSSENDAYFDLLKHYNVA